MAKNVWKDILALTAREWLSLREQIQVVHLHFLSCPTLQLPQAHLQPCNRLLTGSCPPCLPSLETPLNLAADPSFFLPVDSLNPTCSPSPFFSVRTPILKTLSIQNPQWPHLAGTQVGQPHYTSCLPLWSLHSYPQSCNEQLDSMCFFYLSLIHCRLQHLVQTQGTPPPFIPTSLDNSKPYCNPLPTTPPSPCEAYH